MLRDGSFPGLSCTEDQLPLVFSDYHPFHPFWQRLGVVSPVPSGALYKEWDELSSSMKRTKKAHIRWPTNRKLVSGIRCDLTHDLVHCRFIPNEFLASWLKIQLWPFQMTIMLTPWDLRWSDPWPLPDAEVKKRRMNLEMKNWGMTFYPNKWMTSAFSLIPLLVSIFLIPSLHLQCSLYPSLFKFISEHVPLIIIYALEKWAYIEKVTLWIPSHLFMSEAWLALSYLTMCDFDLHICQWHQFLCLC